MKVTKQYGYYSSCTRHLKQLEAKGIEYYQDSIEKLDEGVYELVYNLKQNEMKLSLDILRDAENTITWHGVTFSPVKELILLHLARCRHSPQYIQEALRKPIESKRGTGVRTTLSDYVFFKLWNDEKVFMFNLRRMSDQPYWLYQQLEVWGFDLTDLAGNDPFKSELLEKF